MEKFLFKKIELWILLLVVIGSFIFSILFGAAVRHQLQGGKMLGELGFYIEQIASTPQTLRDIWKGRGGKSDLFAREQRFKERKGFYFTDEPDEKNNLPYLLLNRYDGDLEHSVSELWDLKNQERVHTWNFDNMDNLWVDSDLELQNGQLNVNQFFCNSF